MSQDDPRWGELAGAYSDYAKSLYRHCNLRMRSSEDAEELVQDTFMNAWHYLKDGKKIENVKVFLYRIANNLIVDQARRSKRRREQEVSLEVLSAQGFELRGHDEMSAIQKKLEARRVLEAVRKLGSEEYDLFVMRYIDGLMPADIAVVTGLSANCISVRLHRAMKGIAATFGAEKERSV